MPYSCIVFNPYQSIILIQCHAGYTPIGILHFWNVFQGRSYTMMNEADIALTHFILLLFLSHSQLTSGIYK